MQTEPIFQNLYSLLSQAQLLVDGAPTGGPAFVTTSRKCPQVSSVSAGIQPFMGMMEGGVRIALRKGLNLPRYTFEAACIIFFRNTQGDTGIPSTQMNQLWDAIEYQMTQRTLKADGVTVFPLPGGMRQQLGGVVYDAYAEGTAIRNEGLLNQQGAIAYPITILTGM